MDKPTDYESVLRSSNLLRGTKFHLRKGKLKGKYKNILPVFFSIIVFSSVFITVILKNSDNKNVGLQISPVKSMYEDKFEASVSYSSKDISTSGFRKNIRINDTAGVSEPNIKCSPVNQNIIAVSANDFSVNSERGCIFVSEDGGLNWQTKRIPLSLKFKKSAFSDPWLDFDSFGNLFYTAVQFDLNNKEKEGIFIARSTDNGNTWKTDFNFVDFNGKENIHIDRTKIYIDKSSGRKNTIYVSWNELKGLNSLLMFSRSTDGGNSFSPPVTVEKDNVKYCSLTGDHNGSLYIAFLKDENKISVKRSNDGGMNWSKKSFSADIIPAGIKDQNQYVIKGKTGIRVNSEPSIEISCNNDLLITFSASGLNNDLSDIYFTKLADNSSHLTAAVKVNSDKTNNDQFFPSVTTDQTGTIIIMYQDSRNDANNIFTETFISYSNDNGQNFTDEKFTTANFDPLSIAVGRYIGDYNSCVMSGGNLIGVWTDGRNRNFDIYAGIFRLKEFIESKNQ